MVLCFPIIVVDWSVLWCVFKKRMFSWFFYALFAAFPTSIISHWDLKVLYIPFYHSARLQIWLAYVLCCQLVDSSGFWFVDNAWLLHSCSHCAHIFTCFISLRIIIFITLWLHMCSEVLVERTLERWCYHDACFLTFLSFLSFFPF